MRTRLANVGWTALLLAGIGGCNEGPQTDAGCATAAAVEGEYRCSGECVVRQGDGTLKLTPFSGEKDRIERYPGSQEGLFQVEIAGEGGFQEKEIGVLAGGVLRTATAAVSDGNYPVLEEYLFDGASACRRSGYTKVVRNPSQATFKSCMVKCERTSQ